MKYLRFRARPSLEFKYYRARLLILANFLQQGQVNSRENPMGQNLERPPLGENPNRNIEARNFQEPNPIHQEVQVKLFIMFPCSNYKRSQNLKN